MRICKNLSLSKIPINSNKPNNCVVLTTMFPQNGAFGGDTNRLSYLRCRGLPFGCEGYEVEAFGSSGGCTRSPFLLHGLHGNGVHGMPFDRGQGRDRNCSAYREQVLSLQLTNQIATLLVPVVLLGFQCVCKVELRCLTLRVCRQWYVMGGAGKHQHNFILVDYLYNR